MSIVISPERAEADGISGQELVIVAEWHEERISLIEKSLRSPKRKPLGTTEDIARHRQLAAELRRVASAVKTMTTEREAA